MQLSPRLCSVILTVAWTAFTLFALIVPKIRWPSTVGFCWRSPWSHVADC